MRKSCFTWWPFLQWLLKWLHTRVQPIYLQVDRVGCIYETKSFKFWETQDSRSNLNHLRRFCCLLPKQWFSHAWFLFMCWWKWPFCFVETNEAAGRCSDYVHRVCRLISHSWQNNRTISAKWDGGLRQIFDCASISCLMQRSWANHLKSIPKIHPNMAT